MDFNLFFKVPPPLDPAWLAHEQAANLLFPKPIITDPKERQALYSKTCKDLNVLLLSGRDKHLTENIDIHDSMIGSIPIRNYSYIPASEGPSPPDDAKATIHEKFTCPIIIYYHGGGLVVGDLDSEDLTCRRICKAFQCKVYSVGYRLMPEFTADDSLNDALLAFQTLAPIRKEGPLIIMGSSSGGQLTAQVSQLLGPEGIDLIDGILLRAPVTCDATEGAPRLGEKARSRHTSMNEVFHTSLLANPAVTSSNRTTSPMPLEAEDLSRLPRHWIQVTTNDIYYSDGVCYAEALREAGVDVKLDVVRGWPHTFWLKAPLLERAVKAEKDMIEGLKWLIESEGPREQGK